MTKRRKTIIRTAAVLLVMLMVACGGAEGTDRPGDCDDDEFYDEGNERCVTCPAVVEPECLPGCGFELVEDNRECPQLRCAEGCEGCNEGEIWDEEQERCIGR